MKQNYLKFKVDAEWKNRRIELLDQLKSLECTLRSEIQNIEKNEDYCPNSLGIIQSQGSRIDNLCGKLTVLKDMKEGIQIEEL